MSPDRLDEPSVFIRVALPDALGQPPFVLAVSGLSRTALDRWTAENARVYGFSFTAPATPDAGLSVRTRGGGSSRHPAVTAGVDQPVRMRARRPVTLGCGPHRLTFTRDGPDDLDLAVAPDDDLDPPGRALLDVWLQRSLADRQIAVLHGVAFRIRSHRVLAVGGRRTGKSTIAAAAIAGGGSVVSDDWVLAGAASSGSVVVVPGRTELVFRAPTVAMLSNDLQPRLVPAPEAASARWSLDPTPTDSWCANALAPTSIWWVSIDRRLGVSRLHRITQADTLAALTRSTSAVWLSRFFQRERPRLLGLLRQIVVECPGFRVRLGRDLLARPATSLDRLVLAADAEGPRTP